MSHVKTFRAESMQDALSAVRRELGADAVIVETREASRRRLLPWLKPKAEFVVSARASSSDQAESISVTEESGRASNVPATPMPVLSAEPDNPITRATQIAAELQRIRSQPASLETSELQSTPSDTTLASPASDGDSGITAELTSRLDALQKMVETLTRTTHLRGTEEIPPELFEIYTHLIDADMEDDLARELISGLRANSSPEQLADPQLCRAILSGLVEADLSCTQPITPEPGRRKTVALIGPTGVGKTTTIAKLAANFRLRDGIRMGLVTVDTYRIAAVEQLRTYAEIIDLPMKVVTSPQEMRRALDELSGLDLVLIDTAGRGPRDELKIQELKSMLNEADVDEVHLVVSLTASVRSIRMTCEQFLPINPTALVLTKLDEAAGMGSMLSVSRQVQLPISYLTTGQDVPEDIEPASASRIARLVLGQDRLFD